MSFLPLAAQYMLISAFSFSLMSLCVKLSASNGIPVMEILAARALVSLVLSFIALKAAKIPLFGTNKPLLITRGLAGFIALGFIFYSVSQLPLATASLLQYLNPAFTALLGFFLLKERINAGTFWCIILSLAGVAVMMGSSLSNITNESLPPLAIMAGVAGAAVTGIAYASVKKLSATEHPLVIVFYFPLVALPASIPFLLNNFVMPDLETLVYLVLVGCFTQVGQIYLTKAMKLETAGKTMAYSYFKVVFAALWGFLFLSEVPGLATYAGAALIICGAYLNIAFKSRSE